MYLEYRFPRCIIPYSIHILHVATQYGVLRILRSLTLTESICFRNIKELFEQSVLQVTGPVANPFFKNLAFLTFIVSSSFKSDPSCTCTTIKCYLYLFKTYFNWKSNTQLFTVISLVIRFSCLQTKHETIYNHYFIICRSLFI